MCGSQTNTTWADKGMRVAGMQDLLLQDLMSTEPEEFEYTQPTDHRAMPTRVGWVSRILLASLLDNQESMAVVWEAAALVVFSICANVALVWSYYAKGMAANGNIVTQRRVYSIGSQSSTACCPDEACYISKKQTSFESLSDVLKASCNHAQASQDHGHAAIHVHDQAEASQADMLIMRFMFEGAAKRMCNEPPTTASKCVQNKRGPPAHTSAPIVGLALHDDLDRQSMLLSSANVHGFFAMSSRH